MLTPVRVSVVAALSARAPLYSRRGVQERGLRRRQVSLGGSGEGRRRGGSQGALQVQHNTTTQSKHILGHKAMALDEIRMGQHTLDSGSL